MGGGVYCPTTIVTVEPFLAVLLAPGLWEITMPFCFVFLTGWLCCGDVEPGRPELGRRGVGSAAR